jgi:hypothetical protein
MRILVIIVTLSFIMNVFAGENCVQENTLTARFSTLIEKLEDSTTCRFANGKTMISFKNEEMTALSKGHDSKILDIVVALRNCCKTGNLERKTIKVVGSAQEKNFVIEAKCQQ